MGEGRLADEDGGDEGEGDEEDGSQGSRAVLELLIGEDLAHNPELEYLAEEPHIAVQLFGIATE